MCLESQRCDHGDGLLARFGPDTDLLLELAHIGILGSFVVGLAATVATIAIHGVASMSVSLRPRRGLPSSTAQPRPECWRIHQTNFRHIPKAPSEPRRTVSVGEYPSFSGFSQSYTVIHLNLAYRWFCRLGLDGDVPDHSTFSKNRHGRFRESDLLRKLFETVVARCMKEGIVGGEAFAVDASIIVADAHRRRGVAKIEDLDPTTSRAVAEYLSVLDDAAFGGATPVEPKTISPTDPAARYTASANSLAGYAYSDNYLIDLKHAVILDVEATTTIRQAEVGAAKTMLDRTAEQFGVNPSRLVADGGYGSAEMVGWLVDERGIEPHVNLVDKTERTDGTFSRSDFAFDQESNLYVCPGGKELKKYHRAFAKPRDGLTKDGTIIYFARKHDCEACALKPKCCPNVPARKIARSVHEAARDKARAIAKTEAYAVSGRERKKVEMLFAHLKRILRLGRLRLRGRAEPKTSSYWPPPPKTYGNWRSSSPFRRRSSPPEVQRASSASPKAAHDANRRRAETEFFNEIDVKRKFHAAASNGKGGQESVRS